MICFHDSNMTLLPEVEGEPLFKCCKCGEVGTVFDLTPKELFSSPAPADAEDGER